MLNFCRLEVHVKAYCGEAPDDIRDFGRIVKLTKGLNVIIGDNTKEKDIHCLLFLLCSGYGGIDVSQTW